MLLLCRSAGGTAGSGVGGLSSARSAENGPS